MRDPRKYKGPRVAVGLLEEIAIDATKLASNGAHGRAPKKLSFAAKRAAILIGFLMYDGDKARPSVTQLALVLGISERKVLVHLARLRASGVIARDDEGYWRFPALEYAGKHADMPTGMLRPNTEWAGGNMPWFVFKHPALDDGAKFLWVRLAWCGHGSDGSDGKIFPSISWLAKELGASSRSTIDRWIKQLVAHGLIAVLPGWSNHYALAELPEDPPPALNLTREQAVQVRELERIWRAGLEEAKTDCWMHGVETLNVKPWTAAQRRALVMQVSPRYGAEATERMIEFAAKNWFALAEKWHLSLERPTVRIVIDHASSLSFAIEEVAHAAAGAE